MATFTLEIQYPDAQGPRILDALRSTYNASTAQAVEAFRQSVRSQLQLLVLQHERAQREAGAPAPPDLT